MHSPHLTHSQYRIGYDATSAQEREHEANLALTLATLAFLACFYAWSLFGPLGPQLQAHLHVTDVQLSLLIATPVLLGSIMRIPMGILTDRYGGRTVFLALMGFVLLPLLALGIWHNTYGVVVAFGFLLGFAGSSFAVGVPYVNRWYPPQRQGFALGIYGIGNGGTVLAGLTVPRFAKAWGLSAPFFIAAGVIAAAAAAFALLAREAPGERQRTTSMTAHLTVFRRSGRAWALTLFYFVSFGGFTAMYLYLPKLLTSVHHISRSDAGTRAAGFAFLAVAARPVGGWLSDRIGARRILFVSLSATVVLALILADVYKHIVPLTIVVLGLGIAFGLGTGAVFKLVAAWFPGEVGTVTGVVGAAGGLGGFFPPIVMGVVKSETGGYGLGFTLLAIVAALALAVLLALREK
jgi:MFS transporter, NNP family, nitrate/nitrite transporter